MYIVTLETWYSLSSFCPAVALSLPSFLPFSRLTHSLVIVRWFIYSYITLLLISIINPKPIAGVDLSFILSRAQSLARFSLASRCLDVSRTDFPSNTFYALFMSVVKNLPRRSVFPSEDFRESLESWQASSIIPSTIKFHILKLHQRFRVYDVSLNIHV